MKLKDLLQEWLNSIRPLVKQRTIQQYQHIAKVHICSYFGNAKLSSITRRDMQRYVSYLGSNVNLQIGRVLSASTEHVILSVLRQGMQYAHINGYIADNPLVGIRSRRSSYKVVDAFSADEQCKIVMFASTQHRYFGIILSLFTGIRIGELLALQWGDFCEQDSLLSISKTTYMLRSDDGCWQQVTDSPKTDSSVRIVPLAPKIRKLLLQHRADSSSAYIIDNNGRQMSVRHYQAIFQSMLHKLSIPSRGFHALRHTFATRAVEVGVDIKTLSELLGHSRTSITLDRYVHTNLAQKKKAINLLCNNNLY